MFGSRNPHPAPPRQQQPAGSYKRIPEGNPGNSGVAPSYGRPISGGQRPIYDGTPPEKEEYYRGPADNARMGGNGQAGSRGQVWQLKPAKSPGNQFIFGNLYMSLINSELIPPLSITQSRGLAL